MVFAEIKRPRRPEDTEEARIIQRLVPQFRTYGAFHRFSTPPNSPSILFDQPLLPWNWPLNTSPLVHRPPGRTLPKPPNFGHHFGHHFGHLIAHLVLTASLTSSHLDTSVLAGELELNVVDQQTQHPIGARVELKDSRGKARRIPRTVFLGNHFSIYKPTLVPLTGQFAYVIRSGPEYYEEMGSFAIARDATDNHTVELKRFIDMKSHSWWSGDPWAERRVQDAPLLVLAEDLHLLGIPASMADAQDGKPLDRTVVTFDQRSTDTRTIACAPSGGRIHFCGTSSPVTLPDRSDATAAPIALDQTDLLENTHVQIATPNGWDLPLWLATESVDSFLLHQPAVGKTADNPDAMLPGGRPADPYRFSGQHGTGRYYESIYHHILNVGLRIAPAASSLSGITDQAPGTYRTYVQMDGPFDADKWWAGLESGRAMITNGPLIIAKINHQPPGHVFRAAAGQTVTLQPSLSLHMREKIDYLEFIQDGKSVKQVRLDEWVQANGKLDPIVFEQSGWLIIRGVTNHGPTYRYASTAPFHVEIGETPRISRESAEYFLNWTIDRARHLKKTDAPDRAALLKHLRKARDFWKQRVADANAP